MYQLTEFSLKELKILSGLINTEISEKTNRVESINVNIKHQGKIHRDLIDRANENLPELREMHVRILTSIEIVKSKETIQAN